MGNIWANSQESISSSFFRLNWGADFSLSLFQYICKGVGGGSVEKSNVRYGFGTNFPCSVHEWTVLCQKMGRYNGKTAERNLGRRFGPMSKSQKSYFEKFGKNRI
jgi:hypothetical protein